MKPIVRVPLVLLVTAAAISLGVVGVYASSDCVRFITKKVRHHKVSAATAARWAAWDKAHPNWHPKKPLEALAQLDFACAVPMIEKPVDGELPPLQLTSFDFAPDLLSPPDQPPMVAVNQPPQIFPDAPPMAYVSPPIYSPSYPTLMGTPPPPPVRAVQTSIGPAPEPSTWMLLGTSMLAIVTLAYRRPQPAKIVARRRL
jgi:PEP-CTERM motif